VPQIVYFEEPGKEYRRRGTEEEILVSVDNHQQLNCGLETLLRPFAHAVATGYCQKRESARGKAVTFRAAPSLVTQPWQRSEAPAGQISCSSDDPIIAFHTIIQDRLADRAASTGLILRVVLNTSFLLDFVLISLRPKSSLSESSKVAATTGGNARRIFGLSGPTRAPFPPHKLASSARTSSAWQSLVHIPAHLPPQNFGAERSVTESIGIPRTPFFPAQSTPPGATHQS
jgi:hypothetical protein